MAADDQFALLPVPRAQPVLVAAARDYAVHAGRPFQRYRARRRRRRGRVAVRATAVAAAVLGRHRLDQRVHQVVQTVHVLDESGRPGEQQEQRHGQTLANACKRKKKESGKIRVGQSDYHTVYAITSTGGLQPFFKVGRMLRDQNFLEEKRGNRLKNR